MGHHHRALLFIVYDDLQSKFWGRQGVAIDILERIVADKRPEINRLLEMETLDGLIAKALRSPHPRDFRKAIRLPHRMSVIAELKKASPSRGLLREDFNVKEIAQGYQQGGANALSVLTESNYFQGAREYVQAVRETVSLPILRKDFIVDPIQIPESRLLGADAVLLIAAILTYEQMQQYLELCRQLGLSALCEVHDQTELDCVLETGANLIGINNRNLRTFEVDLQTTFTLMRSIPDGITTVSESGIRCYSDIQILRDTGVDAVLVGEKLIRQPDVAQAVKNLFDPDCPTDPEE